MADVIHEPRSIAIIGAGVAGLQALRALQQVPQVKTIAVFERADEVGGVWRENYSGFGAQVKREQYSFVELCGHSGLDMYPTGRQLKLHCDTYVETFGLMPAIRTRTEVKFLQRCSNCWRVVYSETGSSETYTEDFDFVVLAVGNFSEKYVPEIPGSDVFSGSILHSSELQDEKLLRGRHVVVVGFGKSALDCFALASAEAESVTLIARRPAWILPQRFLGLPLEWLASTRWFAKLVFPPYHNACLLVRLLGYIVLPLQTVLWWVLAPLVWCHFLLPWSMWPAYGLRWQLWHGHSVSICNASKIKAVFGSVSTNCIRGHISEMKTGSVVVHDSIRKQEKEISADVVVFATGYREAWSKLFDAKAAEVLDPRKDGPDLYKLILPTGDMTNLAFLGRVLSTCDIVTSFVQAEWLAGLLAGKFEYPNLQARERFSAKLGPEFRASPWQLMLVVCLKCSVAEEVSGLAPQICPDDNVHISGDTVCPLGFQFREAAPEAWSQEILPGCPAERVVSVPAFFNDRQRAAVKTAAAHAGLERLATKPTAAAEVILVYDLGGGTCDVSVLKTGSSGVLQVLATSGDPRLGGEDFDRRLVTHLIDIFKKKFSKDWK
eukprot:s4102_g4.t2